MTPVASAGSSRSAPWGDRSLVGDFSGLRPGVVADYEKRMVKPSWRDAPLCQGRRAGDAVAIGPDDPRRVTLLREYRHTGWMSDGWACTPEDLALLEGHEAAVAIPGPDEIDWAGFPS